MCPRHCSTNRQRIMAVARELVQTRGFNAFSYRDLAERIGIRTSSIHYYFPSKDDLGLELLQQYALDSEGAMRAILAASPDALSRFRAFVGFFGDDACSGSRLCLAGMFASDLETLPAELQAAVRTFFSRSERLVVELLEEGQRAGVFGFTDSAESLARLITASLQGGSLGSRVFADRGRIAEIGRQLETLLHVR